MSPLTSTTYANLYEAGRLPYGTTLISGNDYIVHTDRHNPVLAWVGYGGMTEQRRSWCHGFSLGTYAAWGYSVYSGYHVWKAVQDEYTLITADNAAAGDLITWIGASPDRDFAHSAILRRMVLVNGAPDLHQSLMDSKNGYDPILTNIPLDTMTAQYGTAIRFYRKIRLTG